MAVYDNSYSRFIAWAKILLPLIALAILSTLFLFSHQIDPTKAIPYAKVDVRELAREQRIGTPHYAGVTQDGAAVTIAATEAHPDPADPQHLLASNLTADIKTTAGTRIDLAAADGEIDPVGQTARLENGVDIRTSSGYHVQTAALSAKLDRTLLESDGQISGDAPIGRLNAGKMVLHPDADDKNVYVLVFTGGVKLVYDPSKRGEE